tara:strand:+ start:765 stop:1526 length:762 start_codon:yes stop_codon:yes gene_type:complete
MIPIKIKPAKKCIKPKSKISEHIQRCVDVYSRDHTKLDEKSEKMDGMISFKARNLLNILAEMDNCKYLQIGTYKGACLYSALYKNNLDYAFACDNFSDEDGRFKIAKNLNLDVMLKLMQPRDEEIKFDFYDGNCFSMPLNNIKQKINMYFYDGGHSLADHFLALYYYYPVFETDFIFVCDDWPEEKVKVGTYAAIDQCGYKIVNSYVEQNMYIAHLQKDVSRKDYLLRDRIIGKKSKHCILNPKEIIKKDNDK